MTTIRVRVSEKEKAALKKHGKVSRVVREAITLYLDSERSRALKRLRELQSDGNVKTTTQEQVALIREDKRRWSVRGAEAFGV